jgi:hypothetical protein
MFPVFCIPYGACFYYERESRVGYEVITQVLSMRYHNSSLKRRNY